MCGSRCGREGSFSPAGREAANATMFDDDDRLTVAIYESYCRNDIHAHGILKRNDG
jgi:hypothetical protein